MSGGIEAYGATELARIKRAMATAAKCDAAAITLVNRVAKLRGHVLGGMYHTGACVDVLGGMYHTGACVDVLGGMYHTGACVDILGGLVKAGMHATCRRAHATDCQRLA